MTVAREKLERFQRETNLVSPTTGDSENDQLLAVTNDLSKAKAALLALQSELAGPAQAAAESNEAQSIDLQTLTTLRGSLPALNAEISKLQGEVGPNNPKLVERIATRKSILDQIQTQVADYRKKLVDRVEAQKGRVAFLEHARSDQLKSMIGIQAKRDELASLFREVGFRQDEMERAAKVAAQARLQSQLSFSNIVIIDKATPPTSPAFPKPLLVAVLGVGLGIALGLILALLAEALDRRIRGVSDLEFVASVPVLGILAGRSSSTRRFGITRYRHSLNPRNV